MLRTAPLIDIRPDHLAIVRDILKKRVPQYPVWAFGSRAKWTAKEYSDLDLAVITDSPLSIEQSAALADDFLESELPWKVDAVDWSAISPSFRKVIEKEYVVIQEGKPSCVKGQDTEGTAPNALFQVARADWDWKRLADICRQGGGDIQTGPFGSQLHASDYVRIGVPSIMPQNISEDRVDSYGIARITPSDAERLSRYLVKPGDIVYSRRGDVERRALITERESGWLCGTGCLRVRFGEGIVDPVYASYFLSHPASREWVVRHAVGATMPNLNTSILGSLPFLLPPLPEQRAIAAVLGALDDKIEQNRRTARALERLARAIFRAWFVEFEPVKAKAEGATSFPSMPQDVFDALPTRFVDAEIGPVPDGWEVKALGEVVNLTMGQSPKSEFYNQHGEGLPFHQGVSDHGFRFPTRRVYCTIEGRLADAGDILLSVRAPVGRINVADVKMVLGRGLAGLRHRSGRQSFLLYQMQHLFSEDDTMGEGTIYKSVNKKYLNEIPLLGAPGVVEEAFELVAKPIDQMITSAINESHKLAEMRDYLLPKLLSGSVQFCDATNVPEDVAL